MTSMPELSYDTTNSQQRSDFKRLVLSIAKKLDDVEFEEFISLYDFKPQPQKKKHEIMTLLEEQGKLCMTGESVHNTIKNLKMFGYQDLKKQAEDFHSEYFQGTMSDSHHQHHHHRPAERLYSHPESDSEQADYVTSPVRSTISRETTPASEPTELVYTTGKGVIRRPSQSENPPEVVQASQEEGMEVSEQQNPLGDDSDDEDPLQEAGERDLHFIMHAEEVAQRSEDPNTKVGAVVVKEGRVIGEGHNYLPREGLSWDRKAEKEEDTKYPYVTHAAVTAIQNAYKKKEDPVDTTLYTTHYPSSRDGVFMLEAGVKEIVYLVKNKDWKRRYKTRATKRLFQGKIKSRKVYVPK